MSDAEQMTCQACKCVLRSTYTLVALKFFAQDVFILTFFSLSLVFFFCIPFSDTTGAGCVWASTRVATTTNPGRATGNNSRKVALFLSLFSFVLEFALCAHDENFLCM